MYLQTCFNPKIYDFMNWSNGEMDCWSIKDNIPTP